MKKILFGLMSGALLLTGCDVNQMPTFDDADAFVAFTQASASIQENSTDSIVIEVLCTSLEGISAEVSVAIVEDTTANAAKVGEAFTYYTTTSGDTLTFDKKTTSQYIIIKPIDNGDFTGDKKFSMELKNAKGANLGASKTITITVGDDEHPLAAILGNYGANGTTYYGEGSTWDITISKDEEDLTKVWISNLGGVSLALGAAGKDIYGFVNEEKTEISVPVHQYIGAVSGYYVYLDGEIYETEEAIAVGESLVGKINADGTIYFEDVVYTNAYGDESGSDANLLGYFTYAYHITLTKK